MKKLLAFLDYEVTSPEADSRFFLALAKVILLIFSLVSLVISAYIWIY